MFGVSRQIVHLRLTCTPLIIEFNLTVYESNNLKKTFIIFNKVLSNVR